MIAVKKADDIQVDYRETSDLYGSYEPVDSIEQVYRMLQESEESVAQGRIFPKEEALKKIKTALNT